MHQRFDFLASAFLNNFLLISKDGRYLVIVGDTRRLDNSNKFQLGPFNKSNPSNAENYCLQFWYFMCRPGSSRLKVIYDKTNGYHDSYIFIFNWEEQGKFRMISYCFQIFTL